MFYFSGPQQSIKISSREWSGPVVAAGSETGTTPRVPLTASTAVPPPPDSKVEPDKQVKQEPVNGTEATLTNGVKVQEENTKGSNPTLIQSNRTTSTLGATSTQEQPSGTNASSRIGQPQPTALEERRSPIASSLTMQVNGCPNNFITVI